MSCLRPLCIIRWNGEDMLAIYQSKGWLLKGEEIQTQLLEGDQFPETPWRAMLDFWVQPKALLRSGRDPCPIRGSVARERVFTSLLSSIYCRQMNLETTEVMCPLLDRLPCPVLDSVGCCCHYCSASDIQPTCPLSSAPSLPPPPAAVLPWWLSCSAVLAIAVAFAVSLCLLCLKYFYLCFCPYLTWVASF